MIMLLALLSISILFIWLKRPLPGEPPVMPGYIPIIGHAYRLLGDTTHLWEACKDLTHTCIKKGGVISYSIGPMKIYEVFPERHVITWGSSRKVQKELSHKAGETLATPLVLQMSIDDVVADPDECVTVANACMNKDAISLKYTRNLFGNSIFAAPVPIWKHHRKVLNPAFNQQVLDGFIGVFNKQSRKLADTLAKELGKGPFNHTFYLRQSALETICLTAMGIDISDDSELSTRYIRTLEDILINFMNRFKRPWLHPEFFYKWSSISKKHEKFTKMLREMGDTVLQRRKAENKSKYQDGLNKGSETKFKTLMDLLFELEEGIFTDQDIKDEVDTMIIVGHESTAAVLTYALLLIGSFPRVQDRLVIEIKEVLGKEDRDVTRQDLSRLVYLEAVIKETMRFYPISPFITRFIDKDVKLKNYTLRVGHSCALMIYGVHRHPTWGEDAEIFRPERWLDPASLPSNPNAFLAFGAGKRNCIGRIYAMMSMKIILTHVLRNYRVTGDHTKMKLKLDVLLKPLSGHYISIEKRMIESQKI